MHSEVASSSHVMQTPPPPSSPSLLGITLLHHTHPESKITGIAAQKARFSLWLSSEAARSFRLSPMPIH